MLLNYGIIFDNMTLESPKKIIYIKAKHHWLMSTTKWIAMKFCTQIPITSYVLKKELFKREKQHKKNIDFVADRYKCFIEKMTEIISADLLSFVTKIRIICRTFPIIVVLIASHPLEF